MYSTFTGRPNDLRIPRVNQASFGSRSIRFERARLRSHLPENIKSSDNLFIFKQPVKDWNGPSCLPLCQELLMKMNYISLQPWVVVTLWGSGACAFGLDLCPLGAILGCILFLACLVENPARILADS